MRQPMTPRFHTALAFGAVALAAACSNAGSDLGFGPVTTGVVNVGVYLDRDGSRTFTALDTVFAKARVALFVAGSVDTLRTVATDSKGIALFQDVPAGRYRVAVEPRSLGDSIQVLAYDSAQVTVTAKSGGSAVVARVGWPEVTVRQARALPAGKKVFIRGLVLAGVQSFRDTTSHVADSSGQIRLTRVTLRGGLLGNNPGDSVTVLGTVSSRAGQPTLDQALIVTFATRPAPVPLPVTTAVAALASGGTLDAGLVQITGATIDSVATVAPDLRLVVDDGSGPLTVILDGNLGFPSGPFTVGRVLTAKGVLVPDGTGRWIFKPRSFGDVTLN
jgi:hypothetical protein